MPQTWRLELDRLPHDGCFWEERRWFDRNDIRLPKPPVSAVTIFEYVDLAGVLQELPLDTSFGADPSLPACAYQLQTGSETQPARLRPAFARCWPHTRCVAGAVRITFTCGYDVVPVPIVQAIKLMAQAYYNSDGIDVPTPVAVTSLLGPYRNLVS